MFASEDESREDIVGLYHRAWEHAAGTFAAKKLDDVGEVPWWRPGHRTVTLHRILVHMVTETDRHAGHADIIREMIDSAAGLGPDRTSMPGDGYDWVAHHDRLERIARRSRPVVAGARPPAADRDPEVGGLHGTALNKQRVSRSGVHACRPKQERVLVLAMTGSQAVLDGVRDLLPTFRERADDAERLRVVPEASIKELEEVGFFRLLQPQRFDGLEADPIDFYTAVRDIASACGSTGWVSSVVGVHPWQVALFADEAQQAVWGEDTATRLSSSYAPTGKAVVADGGYTLSGKWSFSSGCDHCTWVLLGGLVFNAEGQVVDFKTFMVPREKYQIVDVWNVVGLRGTGSNDIIVDEVFIPEAFTLSMGETGQCRGPGQEQNTSDLYKLPFHSIFTGTITTPIIGMAKGAYAEHVDMQQKRVRAAYLGEKASLDPFAAVRIARASSEIDAAWALLVHNIREEQAHVEKGEKIPLELRLRVRRDQVLGTQRAIDAIDALFEASGGRALAEGTYLQRAWRDAHAGRVHAANDPERALQMYGAQRVRAQGRPGDVLSDPLIRRRGRSRPHAPPGSRRPRRGRSA